MTRVLSIERVAVEPPEWMFVLGAVMLALGVAGVMWTAIKMLR